MVTLMTPSRLDEKRGTDHAHAHLHETPHVSIGKRSITKCNHTLTKPPAQRAASRVDALPSHADANTYLKTLAHNQAEARRNARSCARPMRAHFAAPPNPCAWSKTKRATNQAYSGPCPPNQMPLNHIFPSRCWANCQPMVHERSFPTTQPEWPFGGELNKCHLAHEQMQRRIIAQTHMQGDGADTSVTGNARTNKRETRSSAHCATPLPLSRTPYCSARPHERVRALATGHARDTRSRAGSRSASATFPRPNMPMQRFKV